MINCLSIRRYKNINMDEEYITRIANGLFDEAYMAKRYLLTMEQMRSCIAKYRDEMSHSVAFYNNAYSAMMYATTMALARFYDNNSDSIGWKKLCDAFAQYVNQVPSNDTYKIEIKLCDVHLFSENKEFYDRLQDEKQKCVWNSIQTCGIMMKMKPKECIYYYKKKKKSLNKHLSNLSKQRNKAFAHNDEVQCFDYEDIDSTFPLDVDAMTALADYALEFSRFVIAYITGTVKMIPGKNDNDLENTLLLVKRAMSSSEILH